MIRLVTRIFRVALFLLVLPFVAMFGGRVAQDRWLKDLLGER